MRFGWNRQHFKIVLKIIELRDANCVKLWNFHLVGTMNQNPLRNRETRNLLGNYSERVHCQSRRCCAHFRNLFCSFKETKFSWKKKWQKSRHFLGLLIDDCCYSLKIWEFKKKNEITGHLADIFTWPLDDAEQAALLASKWKQRNEKFESLGWFFCSNESPPFIAII